MFASSRSGTLGALALTLLADAQHGHDRVDHGGDPSERRVPLYRDLGSHHHPVTTTSPVAQAYFDQGLRLQYAFNHPEAVRSYRAGLEEDPSCAMCWWGITLASGHNINQSLTEKANREAYPAASPHASAAMVSLNPSGSMTVNARAPQGMSVGPSWRDPPRASTFAARWSTSWMVLRWSLKP